LRCSPPFPPSCVSSPPASKKMKTRKGVSLIEIIVASMLLVTVAMAVSFLLLSTLTGHQREEATHNVSLGAKKLREMLKSYVTADTSVVLNAPGSPAWHLPEDSSCASCWALEEGTHEATSLLPLSFREKYGATMKYSVKKELFNGREVRNVRISVDWSLP